jgi:predicted dehydrogenase
MMAAFTSTRGIRALSLRPAGVDWAKRMGGLVGEGQHLSPACRARRLNSRIGRFCAQTRQKERRRLVDKTKIGLVGCGVIANNAYLPGTVGTPTAELVAVCDIVEDRAKAAAEKFNVPQVYTDLDQMLETSSIEMVIDTTHIQAHYEVNLKALQAGKHLYSEKPLAGSVKEATTLIEEAKKRNLKLGAAAATMLGSTNQKIRALIEDGAIGKVAFAKARNSHEGAAYFPFWATDPTWFFKPGGGPMLDLAVYGLHTLTGILGPAKRVTCLSGISDPVRYVRGGPYKGKRIDVEMDDNTLIMLDFGNATFAFVDGTFCVRAATGPSLEIYGSKGTITVPGDRQGPPLKLYREDLDLGIRGWTEPELGERDNWFTGAIGHMIECIQQEKEPIVSGEHARHVIEIMTRCYDAAQEGRIVELNTTF